MNYDRWQKRAIEDGLKTRRVVVLMGSRQCGKTTLAKEFIEEGVEYRTLDDVTLAEAAEADPHGFVKRRGARLMIIDEVQRVPNLIRAIKKEVDEDNALGQYLLTGSADIRTLPGVKESLAGRVRRVRLRPLSCGEIGGRGSVFLEKAFDGVFETGSELLDKNDLIGLGFRGGYPEALRLDMGERKLWYKGYIDALLERDLRDILNIRRKGAMRELVEVLGAWSGKYMNYEAIGRGLQIERSTLEEYVNALESLYLIERVRPWLKTDYERVGKQSKLYMTDCGLMASILKWRQDDIEFDSDRVGKFVETYVYNELAANVDVGGGMYELYQYRDREKREVDLLVERDDGALLGVEVKAGSAISKDSFKGLRWFKEHMAKDRPFKGIVIYTGEHVVEFGENMWGVPVSCL